MDLELIENSLYARRYRDNGEHPDQVDPVDIVDIVDRFTVPRFMLHYVHFPSTQ